jgi:hypothetical protein
MPSPREPVLPDGMKDLLETIRADEAAQVQEDSGHFQHMRQLRLALEGHWIKSSDLLVILARSIDHDLLFTEDFELVRPKIHEIAADEWAQVFSRLPLVATQRAQTAIINAATRGVWEIICRSRPRYVGDRRAFPYQIQD